VVANFKETQLDKMKPGQEVELKVDAFPDETFKAKVESISPATGAKFALLPPDNSSGNFVKVVQRVPVKIVLEDAEKARNLRAGMNVIVDVHID
jgi:membrane fusion protein (multidrug efflux system)